MRFAVAFVASHMTSKQIPQKANNQTAIMDAHAIVLYCSYNGEAIKNGVYVPAINK